MAAHRGQSTDRPGDAAGIWDGLNWLARREGYIVQRVPYGPADSVTNWENRQIQVRDDLAESEAARALLHELGHVLANGQEFHPAGSTTAGCRGIQKLTADSIAFIAATRLGMDRVRLRVAVRSELGRKRSSCPAGRDYSGRWRACHRGRREDYHASRHHGLRHTASADGHRLSATRRRAPGARPAAASRRRSPQGRRALLPEPATARLGTSISDLARPGPRRRGAMAYRPRACRVDHIAKPPARPRP